jgi:ribosomal protein S18 acetylase RimI-like enzyme
MDIKIVKPIEKHIPQMVKLADEARQHHVDIFNGYFKPVTPISSEFEDKSIRNHISEPENNIILIAVDSADNVVGMILGEKLHKPWLEQSYVGHVSNFIVSANMRGYGIGKKLMDAFINECKHSGMQQVDLEVYSKNTASYNFYIEYGFEQIAQKMRIDLY